MLAVFPVALVYSLIRVHKSAETLLDVVLKPALVDSLLGRQPALAVHFPVPPLACVCEVIPALVRPRAVNESIFELALVYVLVRLD